MLTMARLTVALLPTNMLRGMLHGEGDKPAAATSAAARHARLRCEEHARLRAGAREAHVPFACSTYAFACQYRASTRPAHTCTRGAPALRQPAYNYPCRRPRSHPRRLGHGEGHGRSQRGRRRSMHAGAASNSPVAKGCRLQAKGCRLQPPYDAGLQVAGVGRPASLTVGRGLAVACGQRGQLRAQRRLAGTEVAGTPSD